MNLRIVLRKIGATFVCAGLPFLGVGPASGQTAAPAPVRFPAGQPESCAFPHPDEGEVLPFSPPGFSWWFAAPRGQAFYRVIVKKADGVECYRSEPLEDPAHVPTQIFPVGDYRWTVEALDRQGKVLDTWMERSFRIAEGAAAMPWVEAAELLKRVPVEHPRVLYTKAELPALRARVKSRDKSVLDRLAQAAAAAIKRELPTEPDYDKLPTKSEQKLGYKNAYAALRRIHFGMEDMALYYLLTGEKQYGERAKAQLLHVAQWNPEGISSILSTFGDEPGLGLIKTEAHVYDWVYDLMTAEERAVAERMLLARADQIVRRLKKADYLARPVESHNGRLAPYLVEHAIALADKPEAQVWLDYAVRILMTVYPHWGGRDGGWAEGAPYSLGYNPIYLSGLEALRAGTGLDLWKRPFYSKVRYFWVYCVTPHGENMPFGDMEDIGVPPRAETIYNLVVFHSNRYNDPLTRGWAELLRNTKGEKPVRADDMALLQSDAVAPGDPALLPPDRAFHGIGWAALHSNLGDPGQDVTLLFKCSPYGGVSHSHADQNSFAIMKGGKSLAIPAGERWPLHGSPFHTEYVQTTAAHNAILVNGQGQINRKSGAGGTLADFQTNPLFGYALGDAANCYGDMLSRARRHMLLVRPSLIVCVDDLEAPAAADYQWLFHARERLELDEAGQTFISRRGEEAMRVALFTSGGFSFSQTDAWPVEPKKGYETAKQKLPEIQWHFAAATREKAAARRIAAIMVLAEKGQFPACKVERDASGVFRVRAKMGERQADIVIDLRPGQATDTPILSVTATDGTRTEKLEAK